MSNHVDYSKFTPHNPSQQCIDRVIDKIDIADDCTYCGAAVTLQHHNRVYGKAYGNWPWLYKCTCCDAQVGLHPGTNLPLGKLADGRLRKARIASKAKFTQAMQSRNLTRGQMYQELADMMGIDVSQCHFGWFDLNQCKQVIEIFDSNQISLPFASPPLDNKRP